MKYVLNNFYIYYSITNLFTEIKYEESNLIFRFFRDGYGRDESLKQT